MRLRILFTLLTTLLVVTAIGLIVISSQISNTAFYIAEGFLTLCIVFSCYFYFKIMKPLNALNTGLELLRTQDFSNRLSLTGQKDTDHIVEIFNKMINQLKNERLKVREQNHFLDLIISNSPMGVIILNFDNEITLINKSAITLLELKSDQDVINKNINTISTPLAKRINTLSQGSTETIRIGNAKIFRCSRLSFIDQGFLRPFILIESLTEEVMTAEKKAYERVIRMIAHEVNNSVTGVTSILDSINEINLTNDSSIDISEVMTICIERCYGLSKFITRFANVVKIPTPITEYINLNDCISKSKAFMESICLNRDITLSLNLCNEDIMVNIDTTLFEQVLVNIIKNSAESIVNDGEISISTNSNPPSLIIADNGKGIPSDTADKLFTPFFSTKPNGEGLGLIFIREVLLKHNCNFSLYTYDDGITRFTISF
ncbi:MAG: PAS domain-containing protein [Muribaculaceae bacterium]|nr:PAS domain-containing protein [Muribaculaceae bacterium]